MQRFHVAVAMAALCAACGCSPERLIEAAVADIPDTAYSVVEGQPVIFIAACGTLASDVVQLRETDVWGEPMGDPVDVRLPDGAAAGVARVGVGSELARIGIDDPGRLGSDRSVQIVMDLGNSTAFSDLGGPWPAYPSSVGESDQDPDSGYRDLEAEPLTCDA